MEQSPPDHVLASFGFDGATLTRTGVGHIHDTFVATVASDRWVLQRINTGVMGPPEPLMANALATSECVAAAGGAALDYGHAPDARRFVVSDGVAWRSYRYVEGDVTARPETAGAARSIGCGFGAFDAALATRDPAGWHTVIAGYHDHGRRFADLASAEAADVADRVGGCRPEIEVIAELILAVEATEEFAAWHEAPRRIAHHDAKGVNLVVRPDGRTTVLDLDTVMAGTILSDIGELIRTCTRPGDPSEPFETDLAEAAARGFIEGWGLGLTNAEATAVPLAGVLMTLQNAVRFLTDHLDGDVYYRVATAAENLERARAMLSHAQSQLEVVDDFRRRILST